MSVRDLPPLAAIRVFEAAARHLSFTRAANELGMTQAAVSYQIKVLEERLGTPLFMRKPRAVELTSAGELLAPSATDALDRLASAFSALKADTGGVLSLNVVPTFAANWLAYRIGAFQMLNPQMAVRISANREMVNFDRDDVDLAVRSGPGDWPGLSKHRLIEQNFTPMLSPKLIDRLGMPREPADLLHFPLVDAGDPWWAIWFREAGAEGFNVGQRPDSRMGDQHLEGRAAIGGSGVGILTPAFYQEELANGLLVQPFEVVATEGRAYWLCYATARRNVPKIRLFRDWLLEEIERERGSTPAPQPPVSA